MNEIEFTHAQFGTPVVLFVDMIYSVVVSKTTGYVALVGNAGAAIPVTGEFNEVLERVRKAKAALKQNTTQGE